MASVASSMRVQVRDRSPQRCSPAARSFVFWVPSPNLNPEDHSGSFNTAPCRPSGSAFTLQRRSRCRRNSTLKSIVTSSAPSLQRRVRDCARRPCDCPRIGTLVVTVTIHNHKRQKSAESKMALLAKEEGIPPDRRLADRETTYGIAFWADVRARLADTD